jgi:hypothetical protein
VELKNQQLRCDSIEYVKAEAAVAAQAGSRPVTYDMTMTHELYGCCCCCCCCCSCRYFPGPYDAYVEAKAAAALAGSRHVTYDMTVMQSKGMNCTEWMLPAFRYFPGPYDAYVEAKAAAALAGSRQAAALDKQRKHMEASIAAAEKQARQVRRLILLYSHILFHSNTKQRNTLLHTCIRFRQLFVYTIDMNL